MNRIATVKHLKGLVSALLVVTVAALVVIPITSTLIQNGERSMAAEMGVYFLLLLIWIVLAVALGIAYLASEGSKWVKPVTLPIQREEEG